MTSVQWIALALAAALFVYLVVALFRPDLFD